MDCKLFAAGSLPSLHPQRSLDPDQPALRVPHPVPGGHRSPQVTAHCPAVAVAAALPGLHQQEPGGGAGGRALHLSPQHPHGGQQGHA